MYAQVEKPKENNSRAVANSVAQKKSNVNQAFGFVDNREDTLQRKRILGLSSGPSNNVIQCVTAPADMGQARIEHLGALKRNKKDRDALWKYVKEGVNQNKDKRLKNSAELVIGGHMTVFALSQTGDSRERADHNGNNGQVSLFPRGTVAADPGSITSNQADYNYQDLDDNTNIEFDDNDTVGWNVGAQRLISVVNASGMSKDYFYETLRHEAQHATDDHGNTDWERYKTEFRAYFYENNWDEGVPLRHKLLSITFTDSVANLNFNFQTKTQLKIFKQIYNQYLYVKTAWDTDAPGFRAQVMGYHMPDTFAINKYNSARVQTFNQAVTALPGPIINDGNDAGVVNLYDFIRDPSRLNTGEARYIIENPLIMDSVNAKVGGAALVKIRFALINLT